MFADLDARNVGRNWLELAAILGRRIGFQVPQIEVARPASFPDENHRSVPGDLACLGLLGPKAQPVWGPDLSQSSGIERVVMAQSGLAGVAFLSRDAQRNGVDLKLRRQWSWELGRAPLPSYSAIQLTSADLRPRDVLLPARATGQAS